MLEPRSRRLLLDALRPPPGHRFDGAVGTSFTLDLLALMSAPLAFTFFDWEDHDGRMTADPLALLEAVRRHSDRIALFCQAGRIDVPASGRRLLLYLEDSVFEAVAPHPAGLFHPKVWVVRYVSDDGAVRYRFLCLSRNLTFDRSWDTALVLDGTLEDRKRAIAANRPLADFVARLPDLAVREVPAATRASISRMAEEVRRVRFELPDGIDECEFWPLGLDPGRPVWPFPDPAPGRRMLVVSPFLGEGLLGRISEGRPPGCLISRPESLVEIRRETLAAFEQSYVLHPGADPEDLDEAECAPAEGAEVANDAAMAESPFVGLHAKLYVVDDGWNASMWTGSANATEAAFERNVEMLVRLTGKRAVCGIDAVLGLGDKTGGEGRLGQFLVPFEPAEAVIDEDARSLELAMEKVRSALGRFRLCARAEAVPGSNVYTLSLVADEPWPALPEGLRLDCWPVTLPAGAAVAMQVGGAGAVARFDAITADSLTRFFAIEARLRVDGRDGSARFVVNVPLEGAPEDRRERILRALLSDSKQVLRLIWLLLSEEDVTVEEWVDVGTGSGTGSSTAAGDPGFPILESMLRAIDRDPRKLDAVARLVEDLRRTPEGAALLPQGFDAVWDPIWKVREEIR